MSKEEPPQNNGPSDPSELIRTEAPVQAYEEMYEEEGFYDLHYSQSHYYPMFAKTLEEVQRTGGKSVIEVGCGSGSFAQMLMDRSDKISYRGFDFSEPGVKKAIERTGRSDLFKVANALEPDSYSESYDTVVCTEVLEHIEQDREVIANWKPEAMCVCTVPNFDFETHVRFFRTEEQVSARYGDLIDIERITRVPRSLVRGRGWPEYLRQLRWNRDNPKRFFALLGYKTFDNLAGWFVFTGRRKP